VPTGKNELIDARLHSSPGERNSLVSRLVPCRDDNDDDEVIDTVPITDTALPHPSAYCLTESLVAMTMSKLSMQQREKEYYDIPSVSDVIDEDTEEGFLN
jgi:hypothetical protein